MYVWVNVAQHEPQYIVVFSSFLILLGVIISFFWTQNLTIHIFFHHSYFVSRCCSELYHKLKKFQPLSPKSALCFDCSSSVWDPVRLTCEGFPTSVCRHTCATAASALQSVLTSRDAKPAVVVVWASPPTLESPNWPLYVVTTVQAISDIGSMSFSSLYHLSDS